MRNITKIALAVAIPILYNTGPFLTVAMEKYIAGYDQNQAALVNHISSNFGEEFGFNLGHRIFYNDDNFHETAHFLAPFTHATA